MASILALRRAAAASSGLLSRLNCQLRPACYATSVVRSFNTSAQMNRYDEDEDEDDTSDAEVDRRSVPRGTGFFSDAFIPLVPTRSLSQILSLMDQLTENHPSLAASPGVGAGASSVTRRGWEAKEDADALQLRMEMPGLGKEHVKVTVEENTLTVKGEGEGDEDEGDAPGRRYMSRIGLPPKLYKFGEIKAEMKNGVLKVVVPKVKEEERKDVLHVKVD